MTQMRFQIRQDVDQIVMDFALALTEKVSADYAVGYLASRLVDALMQLPTERRNTEVGFIKRELIRELELAKTKKNVA